MQLLHLKKAAVNVVRNLDKNHTWAFSAALSYYFVLSIFPFLILLSAAVAYLPLPNFFPQVLGLIEQVVPAHSMVPLKTFVNDTILSEHRTLFTFGVLFSLWTASSGFSALIEALNTAYGVSEGRPYWKTRPLAIGLTFSVGFLLVVALGLLVVGPGLSAWLTQRLGMGPLWAYLRWTVAIVCTVLGVELLYFVAPNARQRFVNMLPGAVIAVSGWIGLSYLLAVYFQRFPDFGKNYADLGTALAFAVWLYWTGFIVLIGAQFNSQLFPERRPANDSSQTDAANRHADRDLAA